MRWIPILVAAYIISNNVLVYRCFSSGLCGNKFEAHGHGLFNFSKKDSANRHALKTKFTFTVLCFSLRETFQTKNLCWKDIVTKSYKLYRL